MSKIRFFGLGGLGENGKNMYICEVDNNIFILDAGLKYPSVDLLGIDAVYPDMTYLEEHRNNIQGIFLSHGHEDHIGAVVEVLKRFNISVYGTHFTISILEDNITEAGLNIKDYKLYRINEDKVLKFGTVKVEFYNVSHSIPEAINIAIITKDGCIVYAPDFSFDVNNDRRYQISFNRINDISKYGVLAVCPESLGTSNTTRTSSNTELDYAVRKAVLRKGRVFFTVFSTDLEKIQRVIDISVKNGRRVALIGRKTQRIVNIAIERGYLKTPQDKLVSLKFRDEVITNEDPDLAIIITGARHEPFYMLQRMCNGQDRLLQLNKTDEVLLLTPPVPGTERIAARTMGIVLESGANIIQLSKDSLRSAHANPSNLKMLYSMLKPKYIIPIIGEYRHQYQQKNVAIDAGYNPNNIIILDNGQVAEFENGTYKGSLNKVSTGDVLVDGSIIGDINEVVLKDREVLSEEGIMFVSLSVDLKKRRFLGGPEIVSRGFNAENIEDIIEEMKHITVDTVYSYLNKKNLELNLAIEYLRDKLNSYVYKTTKKRPIIIPSIIDIK